MATPSTFPRSPNSVIPKARKRPGRPAGHFTQHQRIDRLRDLLESEPRGLTLEQLAITLRITQRSVRRYLEVLQSAMELESLATVPGGAHVWRIKPSERGRAVSLRRAQAYALLAGRQTLDVLRGSALYDELDLALGQIEKLAQTPFRSAGKAEISGDNGLASRFFALPYAPRSYSARGEDLDELFRAVADLRVLRFRPRTRAGQPRAERVTFLPYAMLVHRGSIVLLGAKKGEAEVEVVPLEAMTEVRTSETELFTLPLDFDVTDYVHGEFGVAPPSPILATVEFDARVADEIRARKLHPQQRFYAGGPEGRIRVSVPLVNAQAIVAWVLGFGDAARVIAPPELVREVGDILARAAARYAL
jgi:predicted DNA-binding transcriptional regulator YafY